MRTFLLAVLVVGTGLAASGCGGCFSRSHLPVTVNKPRTCLELEVISESKSCGGSTNRELTLVGYNVCGTPLTWPGQDPIPSSNADLKIPITAEKGAHQVTFKLGDEVLLADFTVPG